MALTIISREQYLPAGSTLASFNASTDIRNSSNLGAFTTLAGTMYCRPYGPSLSGVSYANGWSGDIRGSNNSGSFKFTDTATRNFGESGAWYRFSQFDTDSGNKVKFLTYTRDSDSAEIGALLIDSTGKVYLRSNNQGTLTQVDTATLLVWVCYILAWVRTGTNLYKRAVYRKFQGQAATQIYVETVGTTGFENTLLDIRIGSMSDGGTASGYFRMGMPFLANFTDSGFSDAGYPADIIDPPTSFPTWTIRSDGNDNNAGCDPSVPWLTVGKIQSESLNSSGMLGAAAGSVKSVSSITLSGTTATVSITSHGYVTGQLVAIVGASPGWLNQGATITVVDANTFTYAIAALPPQGIAGATIAGTITAKAAAIADGGVVDSNTTGTAIDFGSSSLVNYCRGLSLKFVGSPRFDRTMPNAGWTLVAGSTKTYQLADGADAIGSVVWEADKWLNHPVGANLAAVQASLDATAGSFWSGNTGTPIYLHPFGDTNPNTDGKVYTRSRNRGTPSGNSAVRMEVDDCQVTGDLSYPCTLRKTALARSSDNDPYGAYCVQWGVGGGGGGLFRLANIGIDYFSKHGSGNTANKNNSIGIRDAVTYGQGTPYVASGGQTQDVDFDGTSSNSGNVYIYTNCGGSVNVGVIGSAAGAKSSQYPSWLSHGSGGTPYIGGWFNNCNFPSGYAEQAVTSGTIFVSGGSSAGGAALGCSITVTQHVSRGDPFSVTSSGKVCTLLNMVMVVSNTVSANQFAQVFGSIIGQGIVIDTRGNGSLSGSFKAVWAKLTTASVALQDAIFLVDSVKDFTVVGGFSSTDTVTMDHNAYVLGSGNLIAQSYNDGSTTANRTFAQWQTLGKDASSLKTSDLLLSSTYVPATGSLALAIGGLPAGLVGTYDYQGNARPSNAALADAGAVQVTVPATGNSAILRYLIAGRYIGG